jgi:phosphoribosylanthranilate isomerase
MKKFTLLNEAERTYKVKICGTTSLQDAKMAEDAGADYLGVLVDVAISERSRTLEQASEIAESCEIPVVTLILNKAVDEIINIADSLKPFAVHLLGQTSTEDLQILKDKLDCQVWQTVYLPARGQAEADAEPIRKMMRDYERAGADLIIIDTVSLRKDGSPGRYGGTGKVADWDAAKELVRSVQIPVLLAGGINPDNVREAIFKVNPYGVDLASGVEKSKCIRDTDKVKKLMQRVRSISKNRFTMVSHSPDFTKELAGEIGRRLKPGSLVALCGELGSGKTVFTQGLAAGLDVEGIVTSPTFVIINEHQGRLTLYHIDTYRLNSSDDMRELGYEEYFYGDGVTAVEWAHKIEDLLPEEYLRVELEVKGESDRKLSFIPFGDDYISLVDETRKWLEGYL